MAHKLAVYLGVRLGRRILLSWGSRVNTHATARKVYNANDTTSSTQHEHVPHTRVPVTRRFITLLVYSTCYPSVRTSVRSSACSSSCIFHVEEATLRQ